MKRLLGYGATDTFSRIPFSRSFMESILKRRWRVYVACSRRHRG
jgi:hypothetical protein